MFRQAPPEPSRSHPQLLAPGLPPVDSGSLARTLRSSSDRVAFTSTMDCLPGGESAVVSFTRLPCKAATRDRTPSTPWVGILAEILTVRYVPAFLLCSAAILQIGCQPWRRFFKSWIFHERSDPDAFLRTHTAVTASRTPVTAISGAAVSVSWMISSPSAYVFSLPAANMSH